MVHRPKNLTIKDLKKLITKQLNSSSWWNITRPKGSKFLLTNELGKFWHQHNDGSNEILVYSAFFDDREASEKPWIRILALGTRTNSVPHCFLWYDGINQPLITTNITRHQNGRGYNLLNTFYEQWLISCELPSYSPIPSHISLTPSKFDLPSMLIPVIKPERPEQKIEFGICVTTLYGRPNPIELVEWFEFNSMLGVKEFNLYNASLEPGLERVLKYYDDNGMLRLWHMPPVKPEYTIKGADLNSPAAYNDCMLRNMYRYRFIVVLDFDEVIIPNKRCNYTQLLIKIDQNKKLRKPWRSYTFRNVYHFLESPIDESQPKYLRSMRYRKRIEPSGYLFAPKSFIDPRKCLSVFNHYCWIRFPNLSGPFTIDVPTNIAMSHHFRKCNLGKKTCEKFWKDSFDDQIVLQYKTKLDKRVRKVLETLNMDFT